MTTNQSLLKITAAMPCKQIDINGVGYLQRYYAGESPCKDWDFWLHRFLTEDGDSCLHNHPFIAHSIVLNGGYIEHMGNQYWLRCPVDEPLQAALNLMSGRYKRHPSAHAIMPDTWHRIVTVAPETWTMLAVNRSRADTWQKGDQVIPASPRTWWRGYGVRGENVGDVL